MKILFCILVLINLSTCTNSKKVEKDFSLLLEQKKKLEVYELTYGDHHLKDSLFYEGYGIKDKHMLNWKAITILLSSLKDSNNYLTDRSRNCVLAAKYGIKLASDSINYIVFIGKQPCMKISILNPEEKLEKIFDLSDSNTIIPFFDSLFKK